MVSPIVLVSLQNRFGDVYSGWILWNLFLAFIPLVLSFWLYRRHIYKRSALWWVAFAVFITFLPNAPYMLTDIIHLIRGTPNASAWAVTLVFIPIHVFAIVLGFETYVVSLINQSYYLKRLGLGRLILISELLTHVVCAVGIFLGRFRRYNSWDLVTEPDQVLNATLDDLTSKLPLVVMILTFIILAVLYWVFKQITLGLALRVQYARRGKDVLDEL